MSFEFETAVIRHWSGKWKETVNLPIFPPGGFVITFHKGFEIPHKVEHYNTINEITAKYNQYFWTSPMCGEEPDVVLVGI